MHALAVSGVKNTDWEGLAMESEVHVSGTCLEGRPRGTKPSVWKTAETKNNASEILIVYGSKLNL